MQDAVWIITLVLVALFAAVFLKVLWRASAPAVGSTADPSRYRAPLFWLCVPKIRFYNIGGEGHRELGVT